MKLILNIGMHKTGSSSIQQSFAKYESEKAKYLQLGHPNHSATLMTMFMAHPEKYHAHRKNRRSIDAITELKAKFWRRFESFVAQADVPTILSSAEDVSIMDEGDLQSMRQKLESTFSQITIIGYARPPASFMSSAVQQRIAGGVNWNANSLYPNYQSRFEKFDNVFGKKNVVLTKFSRDTLLNGDVVQDFAAKAGVKIRLDQIVQDNPGRSLEASSVLFAQRSLGRGYQNYNRAPVHNKRLVDVLRTLGSQPVRLHGDLVGPILAKHTDDLKWISERLGCDFTDQPSKDPQAIRSEADLHMIAANHLPEVLTLIANELKNAPTDPKITANAVDMLLDVIRAKDPA
ncbi:MAG: hypothetical protein JKX69_04825 [Rhodobacteraceae bacterium]|nr:hypothetical protein [Paracoccaceae bacterium]